MLLRLVGLAPDRLREGFGVEALRRRDGLEAHEPLQAMQAPARDPPFALALPGHRRLDRLGHRLPVAEAETREQAPGHRVAEGLDELRAQEAEGDGVEKEAAAPPEADHPARGRHLEQVVDSEIFGAHETLYLRGAYLSH